ncbi:hypothetical protein D9C73_019453 [Collichthys lucidus]|uniref:Uncharacterized protein n=1 Tax=Collichthys lucidus TaxID=240159 RepID=A0A4U5VD92_COLLU|nr:hypothetical protein D9C73_019453 [Collichthys lucidus]
MWNPAFIEDELEEQISGRNNFEMVGYQPLNVPFSEELEEQISCRTNLEMVSRESLMNILIHYFETITEAQWNLLGAGTLSPDLEKTLSKMITCILNRLCKDLVYATLKTSKQREYTSQDELRALLDMFNRQIEETLPSCFAEVLNVPAEEGLKNLTYPVQQEVAKMLVCLVALTTDEKNIEDINIKTLPQMILIVATYLHEVIAKLNPRCLRLCCSPQDSRKPEAWFESDGSSLSDDDPAPNLTDSLDDVLAQQNLRSDPVERQTSCDLSYHSMGSQTPCGDVARLLQSVKDFFTRPDLTTEKTGFAAFKERSFCRFADKEFVELIKDIKSAIKLTGRIASLPPGVPGVKNEEMMDKNGSDKVRHTVKPATSVKWVQEISDSEFSIFCTDIVDRFYGHVLSCQITNLPMTGMKRTLSDSVIYRVRRLDTFYKCSPEDLYCIIENLMLKFLHALYIFWTDDNVRHEEAASELNQYRAAQTQRISPNESLMSEEENDIVSLLVTSSLANTIIAPLINTILKKPPRKMKGLVENLDISSIINRLSEALTGEISNPISVRQMKKLNKAVYKGLIKDFGSEKKILAALVSDDRSFDAAVVKQYKIQQNRPTQKNPVSRFFSALGKIAIRFMCCSGCGSDD